MSISNRVMRCLLSAGLLTVLATAFAAEPPLLPEPDDSVGTTGSDLSLEQLQQLALANNPTLEQARSETWKAYGRYTQAGLPPNPELGYQGVEIGNDGRAGQQGLFFQQEFVTGCKLQLQQSVEAYAQQQAQASVTAQEYRVLNGVRSEYYAVLAAERKLQLAETLLEIAEAAEESAQKRLDAVQGSKLDLLQARVERQRAALEVANARIAVDGTVRRLQAIVGVSEPLGEVRGSLEEGIPDLEWDETWVRLQEMSPVIARAQSGIGRAQMVWRRAKAEPIPNVTAQIVTQYDFATNYQVAGVQISVPVPVLNRNQGNIAAAEAEWVRAAREVERLRLALRQSLAETFRRYESNRTRVVQLSQEILPASVETLQLSQRSLTAGEISYLQFLTAQRNYTLLNQEYVDALGELWNTVVAIDGLLLVDGLQAPETTE